MKFKFDLPEELAKFIRERKVNFLRYQSTWGKYNPLTIVKLKCISVKGCKHLIEGNIYYGWEDTGFSGGFHFLNWYSVYKIIHPVLGPRKYNPKRFIKLDSFEY